MFFMSERMEGRKEWIIYGFSSLTSAHAWIFYKISQNVKTSGILYYADINPDTVVYINILDT